MVKHVDLISLEFHFFSMKKSMKAYTDSIYIKSFIFVVVAFLLYGILAQETIIDEPAITANIAASTNVSTNSINVNAPSYVTESLLQDIQKIRRDIHKHAELSGQEKRTAQKVLEYVLKFKPDDYIMNVGGHGMVFLFRLGKVQEGRQTILFRADMDALPIQESPKSLAARDGNHISINPGVLHGCGHDGHTAIVAGMASIVNSIRTNYENSPALNGDVLLLFQPAEETGAGATAMVKDERFTSFDDGIMSRVDAAFALHNLPGYDRAKVLLKKGTFAAASKGVRIELRGATSHASQPENGRSPAGALAQIILQLEQLSQQGRKRLLPQFKDFILLTVVHAHLGTSEVAYGITPGEARVMVTIRTYRDDDMDILVQHVKQIVDNACLEKNLTSDISFSDEFYATRNEDEDVDVNKSLIEKVRKAALQSGLQVQDMTEPFRWSEDFGNFRFKGTTYFGVGAGKDYPSLHNDDYDYDDELTAPALSVFARLTEQFVLTNNKVYH
jgi:amidohydrolase